MNFLLFAAQESAGTSWPDVVLYLIMFAFFAFIIWLIAR